ncbi:Succinate dehydrogenase 2-3 [Hibiscus syriacus]|uniref:Succinate dehydrogenase 2-3 n=1 Tax=Hibiscus syriacus TaxID=106335 RepID=A0A6A2XLF4_HIBSY|nr:uncharacterized protein LOC120185713 [Hibiscus syriacus]KAE8662836.1 Succinate dehydrogenase 2-3 [Hibiscus syriacus]
MGSGNSGSLQSSSGGGEEYDSRVESISVFFNHSPLSRIGHNPLGSQPPPLPVLKQPQSNSSSTMFDPLSYLDHHPLSRSVLNLDAIGSKNLRSEPNYTDLSGFMAASSASPRTQQLFTNQQSHSRDSFPLLQVPQGPESWNQCSVSVTNSQLNNKSKTVRNPKKRNRASRRAPTTVMTTDTTNFRAMVQVFTGIPEPPFTSSPFQGARLDLTHFDPLSPPHYLLRPFVQKLSPPPLLSSSMADTIVSNPRTNTNSSSNNTRSGSTSINYQLPSELGHLKQTQNLLNINMQNPILNFQPLLQTRPKYPLSGSNITGTKSHESLDVRSEFGLSQGHANTSLAELQNMVSSKEHDQSLLRSMNGKVSNLSDFHGDEEPEHVASRSEGMVESWIYSSD